MFLDNDEETILHHGNGSIGRKAEAKEASVRGREVNDRLQGHLNLETRSQALKALYWKMLHRGPEEEQHILLLWCELADNLHRKFKREIISLTQKYVQGGIEII